MLKVILTVLLGVLIVVLEYVYAGPIEATMNKKA